MGSLVLHRESRYNQVIYCYRIHDQLIRCFHWCLHVQAKGLRNDINYAIPLLEQVDIKESDILADRGYDSNKLMDYIYAHGGEPTIPSRKGAKFDRYCDWHLYKERHLVENYFLKLKAFRRIATRYDKLASTFAAFICIASILIWLK
ncbi:transposase [Anaerobutyricum hallii]|uniref:transposase n=1 Tax=Anaerobutyricum hallii TaxID=39488 RepID=UPI00399D41A3